MSRLNTVDPAAAEGKAKDLLGAVKAKMGVTPNLTRVMANSPAVLEGYLGLSGALAGGTLPARLRELLAVTVAEANGCDYCLAAHTALGRQVGLTGDQLLAARRGTADDPKAAAAVALARRVIDARGKVTDADVDAVRSAGFTDGEIAEVVGHVALNTFTNYLNNVARTDLDFPKAPALEPAACPTGRCAV